MPQVVHASDIGKGLAAIAGKLVAIGFTHSTSNPSAAPGDSDANFHINTNTGTLWYWNGTAPWKEASGTGNASDASSGGVELATAAEVSDGTSTGGSGAPLVITPQRLAAVTDMSAAFDSANDRVWVKDISTGKMHWIKAESMLALATETARGTVELATAAEIEAQTAAGGSGAQLAMTASRMKDVANFNPASQTVDADGDFVWMKDASTNKFHWLRVDYMPGTAAAGELHKTRAAFVTWVAAGGQNVRPNGTVMSVEGRSYIADSTSTGANKKIHDITGWVPYGVNTPEHHGADRTGSADSSLALSSWVKSVPGTIARATGQYNHGNRANMYWKIEGGDFDLDLTGSNLNGTGLGTSGTRKTLIQVVGTKSATATTITRDSNGFAQATTTGTAPGHTTTIVAPGHGLAVGDVAYIGSSTKVAPGYDATETRGQRVTVKTVVDANSITVHQIMRHKYPDGATISKVTPAKNFVIRGGLFRGPGRWASGDGDTGLQLQYCEDFEVTGMTIHKYDYNGMRFDACSNGRIHGNTVIQDTDDRGHAAIAYGIAFYDNSEELRIYDNHIEGGKHGIAASRSSEQGIGYDNMIYDNTVQFTRHAGISEHGASWGGEISRNVLIGCKYGINNRTPDTKIIGNSGFGCESLVRLTDNPYNLDIRDNHAEDCSYNVHLPYSDTLIGFNPCGRLRIKGNTGTDLLLNNIHIDPLPLQFTHTNFAVQASGHSVTKLVIAMPTGAFADYAKADALVGWDLFIDRDGTGSATENQRVITKSTPVGGSTLEVEFATIGIAPTSAATYKIRNRLQTLDILDTGGQNVTGRNVYVAGPWQDDIRILGSNDQSSSDNATDTIWVNERSGEERNGRVVLDGMNFPRKGKPVISGQKHILQKITPQLFSQDDDEVGVKAAIEFGATDVYLGNHRYSFANHIAADAPGDLRLHADGAYIDYDGSYATGAVLQIDIQPGKSFENVGMLFIDGKDKCQGFLEVESKGTTDAHRANPRHYCRVYGVYAENSLRTVQSGLDTGLYIQGPFHTATFEQCTVKKVRAASGAELFGSLGAFGLTMAGSGTMRPKHQRYLYNHIEEIACLRPGYPFDADGIRAFMRSNAGTETPEGSLIIQGNSFVEVGNRAIKVHSGVRGHIVNNHDERTGGGVIKERVQINLPANKTFTPGATITQDVTGATGTVIGPNGTDLSLVTNTQELYLHTTSTNWSTANPIKQGGVDMGTPTGVFYNQIQNPVVDHQQAPGVIDAFDIDYDGVRAREFFRNHTDRTGQGPKGGSIITNCTINYRNADNNQTLLAATYGSSVPTTQNLDKRAILSNITVSGSAIRRMWSILSYGSGGHKNVFMMDNVVAGVTSDGVNLAGTTNAEAIIVANNIVNTGTAQLFYSGTSNAAKVYYDRPTMVGWNNLTGASTEHTAGTYTVGLAGTDYFKVEAAQSTFSHNLILEKNNPSLFYRDTAGTISLGGIRQIDGLTYFYSNYNSDGTSGAQGGFSFRVYGTNTAMQALLISADRQMRVFGNITLDCPSAPVEFNDTPANTQQNTLTHNKVDFLSFAVAANDWRSVQMSRRRAAHVVESIGVDVNNWNVNADLYNVKFANATGDRFITGLQDGQPGRRITIINTGTGRLRFQHENAASTDVNRLAIPASGVHNIGPNRAATFQYENSRWWLVASTN